MSIAEPCSGESAYMDLMNAMSSTQVARCGKSSETHAPHWPYCLKFHFGPDDSTFALGSAAPLGLDGDGLAVEAVELGFVVESVDLAGSAVHEQEDDALGLGRKVRGLVRRVGLASRVTTRRRLWPGR